MTKAVHSRLLPLLALTFSGCAPTGVPRDASLQWSVEEGPSWTWKRPASFGCLSWLAVKDWASVQLIVNKRCESNPTVGLAGAKGLTYFSIEDRLIFYGYWPWSPDIYDKLMVFDNRGMILRTLPCPNSLTPSAIAIMQVTAAAAAANAVTNAEKRVISRISERLSLMKGSALSSEQEGCSDWHDGKDSRQQVDPWKPKLVQ